MQSHTDSNQRVHATILKYLESVECGTPLDYASFLSENEDIAVELKGFLETDAYLNQLAAPLRLLVKSFVQPASLHNLQGPHKLDTWTWPLPAHGSATYESAESGAS
jgi:hypothetical protein